MKKLLPALFSVYFVLIAAARASADTYKVDPVHSFVVFKVQHVGAGYVYGRFNDPSGTFNIDTADPSKSSMEVSVPTANLDTHNEMRDKDLKGPDWFNAKQFPSITFKSTSVRGDAKQLQVTGDLTVHGVIKSITVKVDLTGTGKGMKGETRSGIQTEFFIKRGDYDMKNMPGGVGEEVNLAVALEGVKE